MGDHVQVANRRLDARENEALIGMAGMGADAFGHTADLRIDRWPSSCACEFRSSTTAARR